MQSKYNVEMLNEILSIYSKKVSYTAKEIFNDIIIDRDKKVVLYGAGQIGRELAILLYENKYKLSAFLDNNADKVKAINNIRCYKPDEYIKNLKNVESTIVILSLFLPTENLNLICQELKALGYKNIICDYNLLACFCAYGRNQKSDLILSDFSEQIKQVFLLLEDEHSRMIYIENLSAYARWDFSQTVESTGMIQYFDVKVPFSKGYKHFVDCGAFVGDSFEELIRMHDCETYIGFEPDTDNFKRLSYNTELEKNKLDNIFLYPCAVSNQNGYVFFQQDGNLSSAISEENEQAVPVSVVRLDDVLKKQDISMIKMDIEGAEMDALLGAEKIIREQNPDLAICVYHKISDIWEIPLLLKKMCSEYKFYLRCHWPLGTETVLYVTK